jgi:hypothetical protein
MISSPLRLSSWKEIAAYLGRDVRTVMRWEKERGLPIRRGSNGKSGVVFADTTELDAWTRGDLAISDAAVPVTPLDAAVPVTPLDSTPARAAAWRRPAAAAGVVLAVMVAFGGWRVHVSQAKERPHSVVMMDAAVIARDADGSERWRYEVAGERAIPPMARFTNPIEWLAGDAGILAATSERVRSDGLAVRSGQILWFDLTGRLRRSFSFEDRLTIGSRAYSGPWSISDYRLRAAAGTTRIAVAAHHYQWWPSIVTILDASWQRKGTFVNAGWVEQLRWMPDDRLAIAGFSNLKDGGMVALLDANAGSGQSPTGPDTKFECPACGAGRPLRYVVMPRSEVNRVSAAPFNRASLSLRADAIMVLTVELPSVTGAPADALYEFSPQLELVHASYGDRYWEAHRELERVGKITHTSEQCPDRDGPPRIEVWDPATGWTVRATR